MFKIINPAPYQLLWLYSIYGRDRVSRALLRYYSRTHTTLNVKHAHEEGIT